MKILKFTEQNIEPTNEEVSESKLIDKKLGIHIALFMIKNEPELISNVRP